MLRAATLVGLVAQSAGAALPEYAQLEKELKILKATAHTCKHQAAIRAGTMDQQLDTFPGFKAASTTAKKIQFLRSLPFLSPDNCAKLHYGPCVDNPNYIFAGYGCTDWGQDYNGDTINDCSTKDAGVIYSCGVNAVPDQSAAVAVQPYQCEVGGYYDANYGYYYPKDVTVPTSVNYGVGGSGGFDELRANCPVSCQVENPKCLQATAVKG